MTPKQALLAHLAVRDHPGSHPHANATLKQLQARHNASHNEARLLHQHTTIGLDSGEVLASRVVISLAPPKEGNGTAREYRNWTLIVAYLDTGLSQHTLLMGTDVTNAGTAQREAARVLGWQPRWVGQGHGFQAAEHRKESK